ncbi:MAG TPA: class I SAM-dependent methyltransferase [Desulfotomaculum sp.]|nr:MAG: methyltransferase type 11 [Peptococcaceae bacterium BRH_c8a]KJS77753.1 MAG: methyltransferase type 11 [Desulfotomaculum sp. BICA1-6]HBX22771.1 class I SAM-dependent methyltransferase [Desulfotomaculum sp.]
MTKEYSGLARIYDYLVSGVDFDGWIDYVEALLSRFDLQAASIADIACGTGNTVFPFARRGYKTVGVDISGAMLDLARAKAQALNLDVSFIKQDMRKLMLPEQVDLITCFHDGLNYLLDITDIKQTFRQVNDNLRPGGTFIFDLNRVTWLAGSDNSPVLVDDDDMTLFWESEYVQASEIWTIKLTAFVREGNIYHKCTEIHQEKGYHPIEIVASLADTGFNILGSFNAFSFAPADNSSVRHFYVAQKM